MTPQKTLLAYGMWGWDEPPYLKDTRNHNRCYLVMFHPSKWGCTTIAGRALETLKVCDFPYVGFPMHSRQSWCIPI